MGRYTGVGMPKPKKKKVEKPQSTADSSRDDPPAPASPPRGPAPSKPPPSPPSPAKQRVQAMEIPVTENWKGFCLVEKKLKAAEKQFKLEMRIIEAKERSLKQRRPTKSSMALYKRDDDERELIFLRAHWERHVLQWRLLSCEALLGVCHCKHEMQEAEIKRLKRKCNQRLRRVRGANGR